MSKNAHSLKNTMLSCHFFSNSSWKNPCCHVHIWSIKSQFSQSYTILWAKKSIRCLFCRFSRKNQCYYAYILSKNVHSQKKHCTNAHILPIKHPFSQKYNILSCYFCRDSDKKLPSVTLLFGQKNVNSVKTTLYYRQKKSGCPFFFDFSRINHCSRAYILLTKCPFSKKTHSYHAHILL